MSVYPWIIVWALLTASAFLWPSYFGILVLFGWIIGCLVFYRFFALADFGALVRKVSAAGAVWGLIFFGIYFHWLWWLLYGTAGAGLGMSFLLTSGVVLYFTGIYTLCMSAAALIGAGVQRLIAWIGSWWSAILALFCTLIFYDYSMRSWALLLFGEWSGYPLLRPWMPLCVYRPFMILLGASFGGAHQHTMTPHTIFLPPQQQHFAAPPVGNADESLKTLLGHCENVLSKRNRHPFLLLGPEACFPYVLNQVPAQLVDLLTAGDALIFGAFRKNDEGRCYQSLFYITALGKVSWYDKQRCVPFNEYIPDFWAHFSWSKKLFLRHAAPIAAGDAGQSICLDTAHGPVVPLVCSEAFDEMLVAARIEQYRKLALSGPVLLIWFVHDGWFNGPFKRGLAGYAHYLAVRSGGTVHYVGHDGIKVYKAVE